jgi:hypothetical protein
MGRGNWFPGHDLRVCEVVYVEIRSLDEDLDMFAYQDFRAYLTECLSESFDCKPSPAEVRYRFDGLGRDDGCVAFNGLFGIFLDCQGDSDHQGLGILVRSDAPAFAQSRLRGFATKLFDKLQERYDLYVRCCAWTSAPRVSTSQRLEHSSS